MGRADMERAGRAYPTGGSVMWRDASLAILFGAAVATGAAFPGPANAAPRDRLATVLPPVRPAGLGAMRAPLDVATTGTLAARAAAEPGRGAPLPIVPAQATQTAQAPRNVVERASAALNAITTLSAEFTQVGGDGRRLTGTMYLQRPGKLRFEYDKPSALEIVSDGSTVLVRDRKLTTSDLYPISQTPLKFLTATRIDLAGQTTITGVGTEPDGTRISLEDTTTFGGTSRIALVFDGDVANLKRWRVVDPQGYTTTVTLSGIERGKAIDPKVFMLNYMRPVE